MTADLLTHTNISPFYNLAILFGMIACLAQLIYKKKLLVFKAFQELLKKMIIFSKLNKPSMHSH